MGHEGRDCRSSRYATRFSLLKAKKTNRINTVEKHCTYCQKARHKREECWTLNEHSSKERSIKNRSKTDDSRKPKVNTTVKVPKRHSRKESTDSSNNSSEEEAEEATQLKSTRNAREYQITQIKKILHIKLDMVTLPMKEAKKERVTFLLDTRQELLLS